VLIMATAGVIAVESDRAMETSPLTESPRAYARDVNRAERALSISQEDMELQDGLRHRSVPEQSSNIAPREIESSVGSEATLTPSSTGSQEQSQATSTDQCS